MWGWFKGGGGDAATPAAATPQGQQAPTSLFRYLAARAGGKWEEVATNAAPQLYDAHEDSKKAPEWHLEVDGAQEPIDTVVDDQFSFEAKELRVTFFSGEDIWALKFGSPGAFERFLQKYNKAAFENRFGQEQTEATEVKLFGDFAANLNGVENDESRQAWVEDMDLDKPDPRVGAAHFLYAMLQLHRAACKRACGSTARMAEDGRAPSGMQPACFCGRLATLLLPRSLSHSELLSSPRRSCARPPRTGW
jgi:hypothetical protein